MEEYDWSIGDAGRPVAAIITSDVTAAVSVPLPAGRHVYRLLVRAPHSYSLGICCHKEATLVRETQAIAALARPCARMQTHAVAMAQALGLVFTAQDPGTVAAVIGELAAAHGGATGPQEAAAMWAAFAWTLEQSLANDGWEQVRDAWGRLIGTAKADMHRAMKALARAGSGGGSTAGASPPAVTAAARAATEAPLAARASSETARKEEIDIDLHDTTVIAASSKLQSAFRHRSDAKASAAAAAAAAAEARATDMAAVRASWEFVAANLLQFAVVMLRRMLELVPGLLATLPFALEQRQHAYLRDFEGSLEGKPT